MKKRIGVVGIVVEDRENTAEQINQILSNAAENILGRMGLPSREYGLSMISLIVEGTPDEIGAITGKLGNLPGVTLKSALTSKDIKNT